MVAKQPEKKHCDDYIHDVTAPRCLRFYLLWNRMPAADQMLMREFRAQPTLYANYKDMRVRVVMASRLGDLGITENLKAEDGYQYRVHVDDLSNFSDAP